MAIGGICKPTGNARHSIGALFTVNTKQRPRK
jgi:hypothetical protein